MKKVLELEIERDDYGICSERVFDADNNDKLLFHVYNLDEYPEDAIISRDLFSSSQYLQAVRYGIELAKQGYSQVEYVNIN